MYSLRGMLNAKRSYDYTFKHSGWSMARSVLSTYHLQVPWHILEMIAGSASEDMLITEYVKMRMGSRPIMIDMLTLRDKIETAQALFSTRRYISTKDLDMLGLPSWMISRIQGKMDIDGIIIEYVKRRMKVAK